jgi:hypothetical protein
MKANSLSSQWGNLLVLAACYESDVLRPHVDPELLRELFRRTILFFRQISNETSALKVDLRILEALEARLFAHDMSANRSFSSGMSGPPPFEHAMPMPSGHPPPPPLPPMEGAFAQPPPPGHPAPMTM